MILLQPDCLVFRTADGENIPCSVQQVTVELIGDSAAQLDDEVIENVAQAVLHYFKSEMGKTLVSVGEFAQALERVLRGLGYTVRSADETSEESEPSARDEVPVAVSDLCELATVSGKAFELGFFPMLRDELRRHLDQDPNVVRFHGLRPCVKQLMGARRWSLRCQEMSDQIVEFLRRCLCNETVRPSCPLLVE